MHIHRIYTIGAKVVLEVSTLATDGQTHILGSQSLEIRNYMLIHGSLNACHCQGCFAPCFATVLFDSVKGAIR